MMEQDATAACAERHERGARRQARAPLATGARRLIELLPSYCFAGASGVGVAGAAGPGVAGASGDVAGALVAAGEGGASAILRGHITTAITTTITAATKYQSSGS